MARAREEIDRVMGPRTGAADERRAPNLAQTKALGYVLRCVLESMRLYPHPPVLLRRALVPDTFPEVNWAGGRAEPTYSKRRFPVREGQDVMISVYNLHRSPAVWERPDAFEPERFPLDQPPPNETNTDYRFMPFSGGPRKCVGDQFALLEAVIGLTTMLREYDFEMVPGFEPGLTTGATIHTKNGLYLYASRRPLAQAERRIAEPAGAV